MKMPFHLDSFLSRERLCITNTKESLEKEWFNLAGSLLKQAAPLSPNQDLDGFHDSTAMLLTNQIMRLVEDSIISITRFFTCYREREIESISPKHNRSAENYEKVFEDASSLLGDCSGMVPPFIVTLKYQNGIY